MTSPTATMQGTTATRRRSHLWPNVLNVFIAIGTLTFGVFLVVVSQNQFDIKSFGAILAIIAVLLLILETLEHVIPDRPPMVVSWSKKRQVWIVPKAESVLFGNGDLTRTSYTRCLLKDLGFEIEGHADEWHIHVVPPKGWKIARVGKTAWYAAIDEQGMPRFQIRDSDVPALVRLRTKRLSQQ